MKDTDVFICSQIVAAVTGVPLDDRWRLSILLDFDTYSMIERARSHNMVPRVVWRGGADPDSFTCHCVPCYYAPWLDGQMYPSWQIVSRVVDSGDRLHPTMGTRPSIPDMEAK